MPKVGRDRQEGNKTWHVIGTGMLSRQGEVMLLITGVSRMKDEPGENAFISNGLFCVRMKV